MKKMIAGMIAMTLIATAAHAEPGNGAENINRVTVQMTQAALKRQDDKAANTVVSPYNAVTNMALVGSGGEGFTREEMAKVFFGVKGDELQDAVKQLTALNESILAANKGNVEVLTANGIWVNKNAATLQDGFEKMAKEDFKAAINEEDFGDPTIPHKINTWISDNTKGLINNVISQLEPRDAIILASALYFKGAWTSKFDKALTEDRSFTTDARKDFMTPTMRQDFPEDDGTLRAQEGEDYEAVALTYGAKRPPVMGIGGSLPSSRIILLRPKDPRLSARNWLLGQDAAKPLAWLESKSFDDVEGSVELPHLDIKQQHDLIPVLKEMGVEVAFGGGADFSRMATSKEGLYISRVTHDVVFKTDEEGTEAAAVTVSAMAGSGMPAPKKRTDIKFDRSFVFALQDVATGAVLFMGVVNKPNADMKATN